MKEKISDGDTIDRARHLVCDFGELEERPVGMHQLDYDILMIAPKILAIAEKRGAMLLLNRAMIINYQEYGNYDSFDEILEELWYRSDHKRCHLEKARKELDIESSKEWRQIGPEDKIILKEILEVFDDYDCPECGFALIPGTDVQNRVSAVLRRLIQD